MNYKDVIGMFSSHHDQSCYESHYLDFDSTEQDFETAQDFLSKVDKIEITWVPWMGINIRMYDDNKEYCIFVPWRGYNNWYYWYNIDLIIEMPDGSELEYDCSDYQDYN